MRPARPARLTFVPAALYLFLWPALFVFCAGPAQAVPGDLDPSFGGGTGWMTVPAGNKGAFGIALQPDGKIVLTGGVFELTPVARQRLAVWRLLPDGSLDTTFNGTGQTVIALSGNVESIGAAVAVQSDGRIVATGASWVPQNPPFNMTILPMYTLACFLPDGRPDPAFGPDGQGFHRTSYQGSATSIALQPDGKILAGGDSVYSGTSSVALWRCLPNGFSDPSFGATNGFALIGTNFNYITCIAVQGDGKILLGRGDTGFAVTRLLSDGRVDNSFGVNASGHVRVVPVNSNVAICRGVTAMPDGKILAGGQFEKFASPPVAGASGFIAVRFLPDGTVDPAFGDPGGSGTGRITLPFPGSAIATAIQVQSDGRILIAGYRTNPGYHFALGRFTADGTADPSFGTGGAVYSTFTGVYNWCYGLALLPDDKLLAAGAVRYVDESALTDILLARYQVTPPASMSLEYPPGTELSAGAQVNFGPVTAGTGIISIVLKNNGTVTLTGLQAVLTDESVPGDYHAGLSGPATLTPGAQTTAIVSLTPSAPPGVRTATLRVTAATPGVPPRVLALTGATATPLEIWRVTWFGSPDNSGPGADGNDFDHDGLPNFMEYATRTHPHVYSPDPCHPAGEGRFTYSRPAAALTEFSYVPESAPSPDGLWSSAGLTSSILTDDGTVQTVLVSPSSGAPSPHRLFLRLRVIKQ